MRRPALGVFLILGTSYAFFWHGRDWNTASRLMLTYALVDRGSVSIDGLEQQTGDRALYLHHFYSDKLPGFSLIGVAPYAAYKAIARIPGHPVGVAGFAHWPADYWVTLFTSGLATAIAGAMLTRLAVGIGSGPRIAALVGLAYGLATPAYAYATLAYGHQVAAAMLLGSFALLWKTPAGRGRGRYLLAGALAAFASVIELQVAPVSAILGLFAIALAIARKRSWESVVLFGLGALGPTLILLAYNWIAFDSPLRMGYFYHATEQFAAVHSAANPLGLRPPDWSRLDDLTVRPARGLFWYAPILLMAPPGFLILFRRRQIGPAIVATAVVVAVFLVNLSYPEWSGGWSTGPRLLVPLLPFAMLGVAGLLAVGGKRLALLAAILALAGFVVNSSFQAIGARVPDPIREPPPGYVDPLASPLTSAVWPILRGEALPGWTYGHRFARNLVSLALPATIDGLPPSRLWLQFAPLWIGQAGSIALLLLYPGFRPRDPGSGGTVAPPPARRDRG